MRIRLALLAALLLPFIVSIPPAHAAVGLHVSGTQHRRGERQRVRHARHQPRAHLVPDPDRARSPTSRRSAPTRCGWCSAAAGGPPTAPPTWPTSSSLCKPNKLICVLENHDTTGYGEQSGAVHPGPGGRLLDQRAERARPARRTTSSSTSATSRSATTRPRPAGPPATTNAIQPAAQRRVPAHRSWWTRPTGARTGRFTMRDNARHRVRRRPAPQHDLLHPHVRRVRHRGRGHRLPRLVPDRRAAAGDRRVRGQPLRRRPRRGHDHGPGPGQRASATSAGRGAATAAASSTSTR